MEAAILWTPKAAAALTSTTGLLGFFGPIEIMFGHSGAPFVPPSALTNSKLEKKINCKKFVICSDLNKF
jgi:hypothetical protein